MWKKQARSLERISRCETWRSELIVVCFDTDFLITFMREDEKAIKKMKELIGKGLGPGCTTVINAMELYRGAFRSRDNQEVDGVKRLLGMFDMLALTHESAMLAGEIDAKVKSNPIGQSDILIAAIALANNQVLITKNRRHFEKVPGLKVEGW